MSKKQKKVIGHPFYDRHTILGAIVITLIAFLLYQVVFAGIIGLAGRLIAALNSMENTEQVGMLFSEIGAIAGGFILLLLFKRRFYPEYSGAFKPSLRVPAWTFCGLAVLAALIATSLVVDGTDSMGFPSIVNILAAFMAGICEEVVFRGTCAAYLMRQWREKGPLPAIIFSSVLFALVHSFNLIMGAPLVMTFVQVVNAFSIGCLLCVLFLRSGSLLPPIIMHVINDIVAFTNVSAVNEGGSYSGSATISTAELIYTSVFSVIYIVITLYLTRPAVRDEIRTLWDKKWNNEKTEEG